MPGPDTDAVFGMDCVFKVFTVTSSSKPFDLAALDPLTAGIFTAATSGERSARVREGFIDALVGVLEFDVFAHNTDAYVVRGVDDTLQDRKSVV